MHGLARVCWMSVLGLAQGCGMSRRPMRGWLGRVGPELLDGRAGTVAYPGRVAPR